MKYWTTVHTVRYYPPFEALGCNHGAVGHVQTPVVEHSHQIFLNADRSTGGYVLVNLCLQLRIVSRQGDGFFWAARLESLEASSDALVLESKPSAAVYSQMIGLPDPFEWARRCAALGGR